MLSDRGAQHCIGYVDKRAYDIEKVNRDLEKKINLNKKGFELLKAAKHPKNYNNTEKKISNLCQIWSGKDLNQVRKLHSSGNIDEA